MTEEDGYSLTEKGHTALAEAYWRAKIANEIREKCMPLCVCHDCGTVKEAAIIDFCIETALGKSR